AYRNGATDEEALRAGTNVPASQLYADYFRSFGASEPKPIPAASIGPSIVRPGASVGTGGGSTSAPNGSPAEPAAGGGDMLRILPIVAAFVIIGLAVLGLFLLRRRRAGEV